MISGIDAAPRVVTITGAIPVTRIVPASPTTNAPHQFVSRERPPPAYSSSSAAPLRPAEPAGVPGVSSDPILSSLSRGLEQRIPNTSGGRRQGNFEQIGTAGGMVCRALRVLVLQH